MLAHGGRLPGHQTPDNRHYSPACRGGRMIDQSGSGCATFRTASARHAMRFAVPERRTQLGKQNVAPLHERGVVAFRAVGRQLWHNDAHRGVGTVAHDRGGERYRPLRSQRELAMASIPVRAAISPRTLTQGRAFVRLCSSFPSTPREITRFLATVQVRIVSCMSSRSAASRKRRGIRSSLWS